MACVFESFPGTLEKMAMLGIHNGGITRTEAKKRRIELINATENWRSFDVVGIRDVFRADAGGQKFFIGETPNAFNAVTKVVPELADVPRTRKSSGHSNDADGRTRHQSPRAERASRRRCARAENGAGMEYSPPPR